MTEITSFNNRVMNLLTLFQGTYFILGDGEDVAGKQLAQDCCLKAE